MNDIPFLSGRDVPPVNGPAPATPRRPPWSVRRTSTIDTCWNGADGEGLRLRGHARDLLTAAPGGAPLVIAQDSFTATLSMQRQILAIESKPPRPAMDRLINARAGGQLRQAIGEALPEELSAGSPLYLLLDDIAGASLVAPWGLNRWDGNRPHSAANEADIKRRRQSMVGVCIGFSPGSPALTNDMPDRNSMVEPLDITDDPWAWHDLGHSEGPSMRRARRIDVSVGDRIIVEAHFQDSAAQRAGGRLAVHEYLLRATADRESQALLSLEADPRILPFDHCPAAILNIDILLGTPLSALRQTVLDALPRTRGCTHLNDMLRSLAEAPALVAALADARPARPVER